MALARLAAAGAVPAICALLGALLASGCGGGSPPHAAPAFPFAEGSDGQVSLSWNAVTGAKDYTILWSDGTNPGGGLSNEIKSITATTFVHTGLVNFRTYSYRIVAETGGGRGPESNLVSAEPGPVPGPVEWAAVTSNKPRAPTLPPDPNNPNPGHTIYFGTANMATGYRVYVGTTEASLAGRRPNALFEEVAASPNVRATIPINSPLLYRVIAMNGSRIGSDGPIVMTAAHAITTYDLSRLGLAFGDPNADNCLDMVSASGGISGTA